MFSSTSSGMCGATFFSAGMRSGNRYGPTLWMMPMRNGVLSWLLPCEAISRMRSASSSTRCACSTIVAPTGVVVTSLLPRSNIFSPSSSSSFWIASDNAGWLINAFSAARRKLRSCATATMKRSSLRVMSSPVIWAINHIALNNQLD